MRDEEKWSTRPKYEWQGEGHDRKKVKLGDEPVPWFQLASMAQTRAGAKAYRNRLAWVAVMAGYRPTPAEEMTGGETHQTEPSEQTGHFCTIHNTPFFKKGKMKSYAHKIEGTDQWCNEPDVVEGEVVDEPSTKKDFSPGQKLMTAIKETGYTTNEVKAHMVTKYGKENSKDLTPAELKELTSDIKEFQVTRAQPQEELFPEGEK